MGLMKKAIKYTSPAGYLAVRTIEQQANDISDQSPADPASTADALAVPEIEQKLSRKERKAEKQQAFEAAGGIFQCSGAYKDKKKYKLTVTHEKVVVAWAEIGLLGRTGMETMPAESITAVSIEGGRVFKHVSVVGFGQSITAFELNANDAIAAKTAIEKLVVEQKAARSQQPVPVTPSAESVSDRLLKLGELRDAGVITEEEFEAKRSALIEQL